MTDDQLKAVVGRNKVGILCDRTSVFSLVRNMCLTKVEDFFFFFAREESFHAFIGHTHSSNTKRKVQVRSVLFILFFLQFH